MLTSAPTNPQPRSSDQNLLLNERITESLPGRNSDSPAHVRPGIRRDPNAPLIWERSHARASPPRIPRGECPQLYFWRTASGTGVDFVVDTGSALIPIEVKTRATPHPGMTRGIRSFQRDLGDRGGPGFVAHGGTGQLPMGNGVTAVGFAEL